MAEGPETKLVAKIKAAILAGYPGAFVTKNHGSQFSSGMPDLTVVVQGTPVFLEVKAPRENESDASVLSRVTPLQLQTLKKLREAGAVAEAVWSVEQVQELLNRHISKADRATWSQDVRLYSLADAEDKLRKQVEDLEGRCYDMAIELDRYRSNRA